MFCPRCGANRLASAPPDAAGEAPDARASGFADRLRALCRAYRTNTAFAAHDGRADSRVAYEPIDEDQPVRRSRARLYAGGACAAVVLASAVYLTVAGDDAGPLPGVQMVDGVVDASPAQHAELDGGASDAPPLLASSASSAPSPPSLQSTAETTQQAAAPPPSARAVDARGVQANAGERTDISRELAIARSNLGKGSLWPARRAVANALAAQPDNEDAQRLHAELASRERARDALLGYARQCARNSQWSCVRQYAAQAQSVDRSSRAARRLLVRAAVAGGAGSAARAAPRWAAQDGSDNVLDRLRRWIEARTPAHTPVRRYPPQLQSWDHP